MKASELQNVDKEFYIHLLAFNNYRVQATKKVGKNKSKPVYSSFEKFFNYQKEIDKVLGNENKEMSKVKEAYIKLKDYKERR